MSGLVKVRSGEASPSQSQSRGKPRSTYTFANMGNGRLAIVRQTDLSGLRRSGALDKLRERRPDLPTFPIADVLQPAVIKLLSLDWKTTAVDAEAAKKGLYIRPEFLRALP